MRVSFFVKKPRHSPAMPTFFALSKKKYFRKIAYLLILICLKLLQFPTYQK